jgi:hypothetical protein
MSEQKISQDPVQKKKRQLIDQVEKLEGKEEKLTRAEEEVRENEDASLQDESYSFDSDNTGVEEYHDVDDAVEVREDDDYLQ